MGKRRREEDKKWVCKKIHHSHEMRAARANSSYSCFLSVLHFDGVVLFGHFFALCASCELCAVCVGRRGSEPIFFTHQFCVKDENFRTSLLFSFFTVWRVYSQSTERVSLTIGHFFIRPKCEKNDDGEKNENNRSQDRQNIVGRL